MHRSIELVGPRRIRKNSLDAQLDFGHRLFVAHRRTEALCNLLPPQRKIFGAVIKHLRAVMRRRLGPRPRFPRSLNRIANIFAVPQRSLAQQSSIGARTSML